MAKLKVDVSEAQQELERVVVTIKQLNAQLKGVKNNDGNFRPTANAAKKLREQIDFLQKKKSKLTAAIDRNNKSLNTSTKYINNNTKAANKNAKAADNQSKSSKSLAKNLISIISAFGIIASAQMFGNWLRQTFELTKTFDSLRFALEKINKDLLDFQNTTRFITSLTEDYGVELVSTTGRYIKFSAAAKNVGLSVRETENIFRSTTKAAASLGLNTEELTGVYLALEQMLSKGKVTTEELRRQLGERLPGAFGIMASSMGVTIPKLDEMLRKGEILSAEVLPDFADALEVAYGLQSVEKIENLTATQNRLATAWQTFVQQITDSESIINKSLQNIGGFFTNLLNKFTYITSGDDFRLQVSIGEAEDDVLDDLRLFARNRYGIAENWAKADIQLKKDITELKAKLDVEGDVEERRRIINQMREKEKLLIDFNKRIKELEVDVATELFAGTIEPYTEAKKRYDEIYKDFSDVKSGKKVRSMFDQEDLDEARFNLVQATAAYNVYRKFIEQSNVQIVPDNNENNSATKFLKDFSDKSKEAQIELLKADQEYKNQLIKSDETGYLERAVLLKENFNSERQIIRLQREIDIEKAVEHETRKQEEVRKAIEDGKNIEGVSPASYLSKAAEKAINERKIAEYKSYQDLLKAEEEFNNDIIELQKKAQEDSIDMVNDKYNLQIIAAKEAFDKTKKTEQDRANLSKELAKIEIEATNEIIDAKIFLLETVLLEKNLSNEYRADIIRQINELKAAKDSYGKTSERALEQERSFWIDIIPLIAEGIEQIGNIIDNLYERRIQNIEKEIIAEEEKYDKLIQLAENDVEEKKTLERNKAEAVAILEAKRLKEEQKQAKARKAFAIADIALSTAQAIMRAKVQSLSAAFLNPVAGLAWFGIQTALISAIAGLQTAAVLSTPIPQYKEGLLDAKKDHVGMINDGGKQEYVKRGDEILTTKTKNAIINLKKGDTVYKSYDDMINQQLLNPLGINPIGIKENDFDKLFFGIESSIDNGFKKAKINNVINVINKTEDNSYREKLSKW